MKGLITIYLQLFKLKMASHVTARAFVNTDKAPLGIGPYNQAVVVDKTMFISGQIGFHPQERRIVQGYTKMKMGKLGADHWAND